uniref:Aminotransferase-like plant mobile domain-containing protein n=1 Tax=Fagus sylvatica TaxID=28930 RepID=A0A2N9F9W3_FAGSY
MASSSSNPPPGPAMASGGGSENPMADIEIVVVSATDGEGIDPSRFSPVPEDDKESFVFPLLDPWYDNGGNFPYVPSEVSPPPPDWEWMLKGNKVTADRVWVPPLSSIPDLKIQRGDMQPMPIDFEFPCSASADWSHWVADEFLDADFCALLEQAGGEFTITLEDVENHWMLPVLGEMDPSAVEMSEEEIRVEQALMAWSNTRINSWSLYYAKETDHPIRRAAFVAYWLYSICSDEVRGGSCHFITTCFNSSALVGYPSGVVKVWSTPIIVLIEYVGSLAWTKACLGSPSETLPQAPNISPFLKDQAFSYWNQSVSRMVIPCGGRLGICTVAVQEYWLRVAVAMADYVGQGRGTRVPLLNHHAHPVEIVTLSPPTQTAISYADRQNLGFAEWDGPRGELGDRSPIAPGTSKKFVAGSSKTRKKLDVGSPEGSAVDPPIPVKEAVSSATRKKPAPSSTKTASKPWSKNVVALKKAKGQSVEKSAVTPSSGEESPVESAVPADKGFAVPIPSNTIPSERVGDEAEGSDWTLIVIEEVSGDDDTVDAGEGVTGVDEGVAEQQEMVLEITGDVTTEGISAGKDGFGDVVADETQVAVMRDEAALVMADDTAVPIIPDETPIGMADEAYVDTAHGVTLVMADEVLVGAADEACVGAEITPIMVDEASVGSAAEDSQDQDADSVDSEETILAEPQPLQIIPFAAQRDEPRIVDPGRRAPLWWLVITLSQGLSLDSQVPALEGTSIQDVDGGGMADTEVHGVDTVPAGDISLVDESGEAPVSVEKEGVAHVVSAAASSSQTQSAVELITPGGVAAFFVRFEERAPNPYPDWHFWRFEGPLVAYGDFWVYQDAMPLLQRLTAKFGDFTTHFKFGVRFGGPMLSLLGSVLADMRRTSFKTLSESQILSWRSVMQDLIAVGFDLDFMLEHLRKVALRFFSKMIANEIKVVQDHISSLQSTLAVLVSYQGELMSAVAASPEVDEVASPIDGLFD